MSKKKVHSAPNHERWLVSYADFITMMFALFVVLYSTAQSDHAHRAQLAAAIQNAFRQLELFPPASKSPIADASTTGGIAAAPGSGQGNTKAAIAMANSARRTPMGLVDLKKLLEVRLSREIAQQTVSLNLTREGLVISLREVGFFESGSAIARKTSAASLRTIASTLQPASNDLRIEGHTDDMPIQNQQFASNWDLSAARATTIARTLIEEYSFAADRMSIAGYAQYHPISSNGTEIGRALNRRVDLVVLPTTH
jgi:chemotaxis protein MotB